MMGRVRVAMNAEEEGGRWKGEVVKGRERQSLRAECADIVGDQAVPVEERTRWAELRLRNAARK